jgi:thioester reductase-like protein
MNCRAVLVTGATGLLGAEVVAKLAPQARVLAVTNRNPRIVATSGRRMAAIPFGQPVPNDLAVSVINADVRRPGLGLSDELLAKLGHAVCGIIHSAATTSLKAPPDDYARLNVAGTAHTIQLARRWGVPLVHISTAYVCGKRGGRIFESDFNSGQQFSNGYERSKFEAEQLVRDAGDVEWSIVRPAIVAGATKTGAIRDYKNLYTLVKLIVEGKLRRLPGRYDSTLSLVPVDYVADVVAAVWKRLGETPESVRENTFHVTGANTISLREISDVFAEYPSFEIARFVPATSFSVDELDSIERDYYLRLGAQYISYFDRVRTFDDTNTKELMGVDAPDTGADYLRTLLDYCLQSGYLGRPAPTVTDTLAGEELAV